MRVDVPHSIGFIAGAVLTSFLCDNLGLVGIVRLLCIVGGGVLGGMAGEKLAGRAEG